MNAAKQIAPTAYPLWPRLNPIMTGTINNITGIKRFMALNLTLSETDRGGCHVDYCEDVVGDWKKSEAKKA